MRLIHALPLGLVLLASCTSSNPARNDVDSGDAAASDGAPQDAAPTCRYPFPEVATFQLGPEAWNGQCEPGCTPAQSSQRDSTTGCVVHALLCFHSDVGGGGIRNECFENAGDGRIVLAPQWALDGRPGWAVCDPTDQEAVKAGCK